MKKLLIVVFSLMLFGKILAQNISYENYGISNQNNFYADLVSKAATLNGNWGLFGGLSAGYNINRNFSIGLSAIGLIPDKLGGSYINQNGRDELHLGYGGIEAAYNYYISDKIYFTGMLMLGAGRVDYENLGGYDYFFITEPGVSANYMFTNWFGLGLATSYRFAAGVNYADFSDASFSGWAVDLNFKFGF